MIDCVVKSYTSYELNPIEWESIREASLGVLTPKGLESYQKLPGDEEDLQMQWEAAVGRDPLGMRLVLGQLGEDDMRALDDSDYWEDVSYYNEMKKNVFLAYHMIKAHGRFLEENPDEVTHFRRFQLWYRQQAAGGHVPGRTSGDDGFWAAESEDGNESE